MLGLADLPAGNILAVVAGKSKKTSQTLSDKTPNCRITSGEDELGETRAVGGETLNYGS